MFTEKIINKIGYVETLLPVESFSELVDSIKTENFQGNFNYGLAGQMEKEKSFNLQMMPQSIREQILLGCQKYIKAFGHNKFCLLERYNYTFEPISCWVNFQKKYEYNPIHSHFGDLVFVIWIQIPYKLEDEMKYKSSINSNHRIASKFQFTDVSNRYSNYLNDILDVDKSYEGKMVIFHSKMSHTVYPFFTSDDYRISMSGNLNIVLGE